jgi:hypothetical protein
LEPLLFAKVVLAGIAAGESTEQGDPLAVDRVEADGSLSMLQIPDGPHSRAAFAIKREFPHDEKAFRGALARFNALMNLFSRNALGPWAQLRESGNTAMHPAVIDVASSMRLSSNGRFAPRKFTAAVAEVAQQLYPDLPDW